MENRYKIVLSNNNIYKEVELSKDSKQIKIGTGIDCDVRLGKDLFFEPIELLFAKEKSRWVVYCSDNLYITAGDIRKLMTKGLVHGDLLEVKYQASDNFALRFDFLIDFDEGKNAYERVIDLSGAKSLTIGSEKFYNISLRSPYVKNDFVFLDKHNDSFTLNIINSTYGVYINGEKAQSGDVVNNGDFFSISDYFFYYKDDKIYAQIKNDLTINSLNYIDKPSRNSYPKFNRNTRVKNAVCDAKIEVLDPPAKPQKPKSNIILRLMPSLGMLIAAGVMAYFGGMMIIMSAISGTMAIFTTVMSIKESRKDYKTSSAERIRKYNEYIENKKAEIEQCREQECLELENIYVSQLVEKQRFETFSADLFDRVPEDEDYLCVRFGSGDVVAKREINYKKQEKLDIDDKLQLLPQQIFEEYECVHNAPVVCNFKENNAVGIVGAPSYRFELFKNIIFDIVARQHFSNVKMVFIVEPEHKAIVKWLRFLPYVYNEIIGIRNIVCDDESKNLIFEYLYKELTVREQNKNYKENIIVFFYDEYGFKSHPISKFVEKANDLGVTFVFFGDKNADIPQGCGYIASIADKQNATLINAQNNGESLRFVYPTIAMSQAKEIVRLMAPVYTEEISLEKSLTKNVTMFELLNIFAVDDINLEKRWGASQVFKSMAAPIGVSKTSVVSLDLHDKAHGPHGLVAGTTGSGKSELLQTYILSIATLFHPYEVAFVIIDFKGGGMVNQFKDLPHLLGAITNIDGKEINRSLKSIKAELQKRQRLFANADVNHIDKYIKKYKSGQITVPLPHLVIIVDEFAELKAEQPEFMKELISAARIGRSLGVHLILATQKPAGQVNEQIWSNSRFKLCLKVQSQEDSNEVIKSPLAAEIKEPGRAYLQVGNNEIFELFQSAYSGAPEKTDDSNFKTFTIFEMTDSGKRVPVYSQKKKKSGAGSTTQLNSIVKYVADYCSDIKLQKLPNICLPSLKERIDFAVLSAESKEKDKYSVDIGIYDDPDNQYQGTYSVDLETNNLIIIGSSQTGKTNMLQNIIRSLSTKNSPDEVSIYIIDFASMVLKNFDQLNHVGGVVCPSDDEKLKNLFKLLNTEIKKRKDKLISVGVSSFSSYREAGRKDLPLIVLIVDNLTALKELYFEDDDELLYLCREGLTVGISIVIANSQTTGIGYKYLSNFSARTALFCNDSNEYGALFDHCSERIYNIPGRCIVEIDKKHYECQSYLTFRGEKEIDRVLEIRKYISGVNAINQNSMSKKIPIIPTALTDMYMYEQFSDKMKKDFTVVLGLDYETVMPYVINFASLGLLAISGRANAGKHNWVKYSLRTLEQMYPGKSKVYVSDGISKKLNDLKKYKNTAAYSIFADDAKTYIKKIEMLAKKRYDSLSAGNDNAIDDSDLLVLIIDNQDAFSAICNDPESLAAYKNIIGRYKYMKVCVIVFIENANIPYNSVEILKDVRSQKQLVFFDDMSNMKIFDVPLAISRNFKKPIEIGDGYYIKDNEYVKIKTAICTHEKA